MSRNPEPKVMQELHRRLQDWYRREGRHDLPWRKTRDPYRIYLSEIMLQQTRVETVLERFYFPFLERFPTLASVAEAPEEAVLKAWEGLGYYRRARYLHQTAKRTAGRLPPSAQELEELPGIGRSTARAVACFAFDEALPILDANVRRVLHRFFARAKAGERELWALAESLFDEKRAYDYNQAMMDLGAGICTPKSPECARCPLALGCEGKASPERYPEARRRKKVPRRRSRILVHRKGERLALQRAEEGFHGGLWRFPQSEEFAKGRVLGEVRRVYSHFILEASVQEVDALPDDLTVEYLLPEKIEQLPLGAADREALALALREAR